MEILQPDTFRYHDHSMHVLNRTEAVTHFPAEKKGVERKSAGTLITRRSEQKPSRRPRNTVACSSNAVCVLTRAC